MRTAAILAGFVLTAGVASFLRAEETPALVWREDAYAAWKTAQETGRPLLLFITSENCPYCHLMDRNTFADQSVQARLRSSFVATRVEASRQPALTRHLQIQAYPTTVVVDKSNRVVGAIAGYLEPREFERQLAEFME